MAKRTKSLERYFYSLDYEKKIKSKLTRKQFAIYTYLLYLSNWNSIEGENHYYVYRNSFNIKQVCEKLKISQPTWRTGLEKLNDLGFIRILYPKGQTEKLWDKIKIPVPEAYAPLNIKLIGFLLDFSQYINNSGNLVGVYATLYRYWSYLNQNNRECNINITTLCHLFENHCDSDNSKYYQLILGLFNSTGLMTFKREVAYTHGRRYTNYKIIAMCQTLTEEQAETFDAPDLQKDIIEALENSF